MLEYKLRVTNVVTNLDKREIEIPYHSVMVERGEKANSSTAVVNHWKKCDFTRNFSSLVIKMLQIP